MSLQIEEQAQEVQSGLHVLNEAISSLQASNQTDVLQSHIDASISNIASIRQVLRSLSIPVRYTGLLEKEKSLIHTRASVIWSKNGLKTVILWNVVTVEITVFYFNIFLNVIYSCDGKAEFSAVITPVFSVTWSFRYHSNMLICNIS